MTHDFRWVIIFWCCARIDLGLSVAKKIRVLSIKVCPSRRALWNLHFFWFFSKTVIFGNRNMLYDSYLFSTFYLLWKNWKKSGKKRNFEIDFSHSITIISKKSDKFLKNPVSFDKYQKPSKNIEKVRKVPKYPKTFWKIPINCAKSPKWLLWLTNLIIWICISITNSVIIY